MPKAKDNIPALGQSNENNQIEENQKSPIKTATDTTTTTPTTAQQPAQFNMNVLPPGKTSKKKLKMQTQPIGQKLKSIKIQNPRKPREKSLKVRVAHNQNLLQDTVKGVLIKNEHDLFKDCKFPINHSFSKTCSLCSSQVDKVDTRKQNNGELQCGNVAEHFINLKCPIAHQIIKQGGKEGNLICSVCQQEFEGPSKGYTSICHAHKHHSNTDLDCPICKLKISLKEFPLHIFRHCYFGSQEFSCYCDCGEKLVGIVEFYGHLSTKYTGKRLNIRHALKHMSTLTPVRDQALLAFRVYAHVQKHL